MSYAHTPAISQSYPAKPVRFIVPFVPGGGTDFIGRLVAAKLGQAWGQQVIIDNRPGASGNIGAEAGVRAAPDGYTLTLVSSGYTTNAVMTPLKFDAIGDITSVVLLDKGPFLVVVHPSLPVKTAKDLVALARVQPGAINYASSGQGSILHLATELFLSMTKTRMTNIPYKGTGPAITDTIAGQTHVLFGSITATLPHVKSGRLRGIAVTSAERVAAESSIPTLAESGVRGYDVNNWHGLIGPRGLSRALVERINKDIIRIMQESDMEEKLRREGVAPAAGTPEVFLDQMKKEIQTWRRVVEQTGIKIE
ncbi:MAG: tripartite tricarboxylate transporter substrate binding protein [Betaproteobacteria bacterium]|nr:tripartite tricarboxylate transporter substrate binding protein [Betaproteobacteria bacterium]MBI3053508.1 tripartite tricarboxylate transporter substrate binding protein [Betaproteobacteria bacterium]